jgi:hypothetical protein
LGETYILLLPQKSFVDHIRNDGPYPIEIDMPHVEIIGTKDILVNSSVENDLQNNKSNLNIL